MDSLSSPCCSPKSRIQQLQQMQQQQQQQHPPVVQVQVKVQATLAGGAAQVHIINCILHKGLCANSFGKSLLFILQILVTAQMQQALAATAQVHI